MINCHAFPSNSFFAYCQFIRDKITATTMSKALTYSRWEFCTSTNHVVLCRSFWNMVKMGEQRGGGGGRDKALTDMLHRALCSFVGYSVLHENSAIQCFNQLHVRVVKTVASRTCFIAKRFYTDKAIIYIYKEPNVGELNYTISTYQY